ncbi:RIKEN cDNA 6330408A02, isoform CRA_a, partial [Mus musculus]
RSGEAPLCGMVRPGGAAERQVERVSRGPRMELTEPLPSAAVQKEEQELLDRTFFSWAEFSRFFDKWCQQRLVVFSVKSSTRVARSPWANTPPLYRLIHVLKYSYVLLVCKDVRMPNKSTAWCVSLSCDPTGGGEQGVSQTASNPQV